MISCCPAIILEATFTPFFQSNLSTFHSNLFGFRFFACAHAPVLVFTTHPGCQCPPNLTGTPPTHLLPSNHHHHTLPNQLSSAFPSQPLPKQSHIRQFPNFPSQINAPSNNPT